MSLLLFRCYFERDDPDLFLESFFHVLSSYTSITAWVCRYQQKQLGKRAVGVFQGSFSLPLSLSARTLGFSAVEIKKCSIVVRSSGAISALSHAVPSLKQCEVSCNQLITYYSVEI